MEHFCRPDTPAQEFTKVYTKMLHQTEHFFIPEGNTEYQRHLKTFLRLLKALYEARERNGNALQFLQYHLQRSAIDKAMIIVMRLYTANYLETHAQDPNLGPFLDNPALLIRQVNNYGEEAEGVALMAAARCFSVVLHILTIDNKSSNLTETVYGPEVQGLYPSFALLHLPGHYNYLEQRELYEADHYDYQTNTYTPNPTHRIIGYENYLPNY